MRIKTSTTGNTFEARLSDRLTFADHQAFREMIQQVTTTGAKEFVLELSELVSIDSAGLGMFVIAMESGSKNGWSLTLKAPRPSVKQLLLLAKFDKLVTLVD